MAVYHVIDNRPNSEVLEGPRVQWIKQWEASRPDAALVQATTACLYAPIVPKRASGTYAARWIVLDIGTGYQTRFR